MLQQILDKLCVIENQNTKIFKEIAKLNSRFDKLERRKSVKAGKTVIEDLSTARDALKNLKKFSQHATVSFFDAGKIKKLEKKNFERLHKHYEGFLKAFSNQTLNLRVKGQRIYAFDGRTFELVQDKKAFWRNLRSGLAHNFLSSFKYSYLASEGLNGDDYSSDEVFWEPHMKHAYKAFSFCKADLYSFELCKFKKIVCGSLNNTLIDSIRKLTN
jgi:hypothetical protein